MNTLNRYTAEYLSYCEYRKRLNFKTLKAYRIDLNQYSVFCNSSMDFLSRNTLDLYITELHKHYKPKSVKRKIASLKAFFPLSGVRRSFSTEPFRQTGRTFP
ncbi:site-specific integrase [Waltera sp.]|uniref:site-specific integrase n=1 Tax=Waltera sp. TaxID=2815806 RepID=UPI0039A23085